MLTVKEFKDLGVEMHCSDKVQWRHGNQVGVISFAWRPLNTLPDNPKFKYEVNTTPHQWRPLLDQSAVKPSDDKPVFTPWSETYSSDKLPKIKPVFTQAMADAGELPPVGSDFLHAKKVVTCLSVSDYDGGVVTFAYNDRDGQEVDIDCCWNNDSWVQPIDTRTPKQKSVDAIQEVICSQGWLSKERVSKEIAEKLYDAGYRKC